MKLEYLECGKILGPHGVHGDVKAECWCDSPKELAALSVLYLLGKDGKYRALRLEKSSPYRAGVLLTFYEITSPEDAAAYRGMTLYARRNDLDPDGKRVFLAELCGLPVIDADTGKNYGTVRDIDTAHPTVLYVIDTGHGEVLFPAVPEFIRKIDIERHILVRPIPGIFDEL